MPRVPDEETHTPNNQSGGLTLTAQAAAGRRESNYYGQHANASIAGQVYSWKIFRENPYLPAPLASEMDRAGLDMIRLSTTGIIDGPV